MKIFTICPESFAANTYLLVSGKHSLVVDPAVSVAAIKSIAERECTKIEGIILTHGHFDHIISLDTLRHELSIYASIHKNDAPMLLDGHKNAFYTFFGKDRSYAPAEHLLSDNDIIKLGDESIKVVHTPGHSGGSVCYLCPDFMLTGDTLFANSIGRCDLWSGDETEIWESLNKLSKYDKNLKIYPGHGNASLLGAALDNTAYFR